jgi:diaminohydroxyphosphoribosylaminopyrimidine deaminase/5-amino-6-(5-phosphoribosylamino)uracil reductase
MERHEEDMRRALGLAERGWGRVSPNPLVGAVVRSASGDVIGEGWHEGPGTPHAEAMALAQAGTGARGATVVSTLEPCNRFGRTRPPAPRP